MLPLYDMCRKSIKIPTRCLNHGYSLVAASKYQTYCTYGSCNALASYQHERLTLWNAEKSQQMEKLAMDTCLVDIWVEYGKERVKFSGIKNVSTPIDIVQAIRKEWLWNVENPCIAAKFLPASQDDRRHSRLVDLTYPINCAGTLELVEYVT